MGLIETIRKVTGLITARTPPRPDGRLPFASSTVASTIDMPMPSVSGDWLPKAWGYYDTMPEVRLVTSYRAAALSRVGINVARITEDGPETVTNQLTLQIQETLFGGIENHPQALSRLAQHFTIAGGSHILITSDNEWLIIPPDDVNYQPGGGLHYVNPVTGGQVMLPPDQVNQVADLRIWQPHPRKQWEMDSPLRGAIKTLDLINSYNAALASASVSRIIRSGLYFIPQEADLQLPDDFGGSKSEYLAQQLNERARRQIQNPSGPNAPMFVDMPAELIAIMKDKAVEFSTEFDERLPELRDTEIRRFATGQPLPTEMVTGVGDVNHWTGWQLSEEDLKFDIAPLAELLLDTFTKRVIQPVYGDQWMLVPDYSQLVTRPDGTPRAIELFAAGVISRDEAREAAGYLPEPENDTDPLLRIESDRDRDRNLLPGAPEQTQKQNGLAGFTNPIAVDAVHTAGNWLLSRTGRSHRTELAALTPYERHTHPACADSLTEAVTYTAKQLMTKYPGEAQACAIAIRNLADLYEVEL